MISRFLLNFFRAKQESMQTDENKNDQIEEVKTYTVVPSTTKCKIDRLGIFNGAETKVDIEDVKTVFTINQDVKPNSDISTNKEELIDLCDSDSDDDIEMVAVVTNDNKKFKCIKLEDQEDIKKRKISR